MASKKRKNETGEARSYWVSIPITGKVTVVVTATSEEDAIEQAWEHMGDEDADVEWEGHEKIVSGNVFHGSTNEIEVGRND